MAVALALPHSDAEPSLTSLSDSPPSKADEAGALNVELTAMLLDSDDRGAGDDGLEMQAVTDLEGGGMHDSEAHSWKEAHEQHEGGGAQHQHQWIGWERVGGRYRVVGLAEVPEYLRHNRHILSRYRIDLPLPLALLSLFHCHNGASLTRRCLGLPALADCRCLL
jgi:hypothetical protein